MPDCANFDVSTTIFYLQTKLEVQILQEIRADYIAEMLFISASGRKLKKDEKSWMQKMQKIEKDKERALNKKRRKFTRYDFMNKYLA